MTSVEPSDANRGSSARRSPASAVRHPRPGRLAQVRWRSRTDGQPRVGQDRRSVPVTSLALSRSAWLRCEPAKFPCLGTWAGFMARSAARDSHAQRSWPWNGLPGPRSDRIRAWLLAQVSLQWNLARSSLSPAASEWFRRARYSWASRGDEGAVFDLFILRLDERAGPEILWRVRDSPGRLVSRVRVVEHARRPLLRGVRQQSPTGRNPGSRPGRCSGRNRQRRCASPNAAS